MYQECSQRYYTAIQQAKSEYYNERISNSNQKHLFQLVDGLLKVKHAPIAPKYQSAFDLAQRFNMFFSEKIQALRSDLDDQPIRDLMVELDEHPPESLLSISYLYLMMLFLLMLCWNLLLVPLQSLVLLILSLPIC